MRIEKKFHILKRKGIKYLSPDAQKVSHLAARTSIGTLLSFLLENSSPKAKEITVTIES